LDYKELKAKAMEKARKKEGGTDIKGEAKTKQLQQA